MKNSKGKYLAEKPKKNTNPMKITAIVLSAMAAILVLAAVGVGIFVWYSGSVRGSMFASRGSVSDTIPQETAAPTAAAETQALVNADWID